MELFIIFILSLVACIFAPALPDSRKLRLILAAAAVPVFYGSFLWINQLSSYRGSHEIDKFVANSERLLKEGRTGTLQAAYQEYHRQRQHQSKDSTRWDAANCAATLNAAVSYQEIVEKAEAPVMQQPGQPLQ